MASCNLYHAMLVTTATKTHDYSHDIFSCAQLLS